MASSVPKLRSLSATVTIQQEHPEAAFAVPAQFGSPDRMPPRELARVTRECLEFARVQGNPNVIHIGESTVRQGSTLSARLNRKTLAVNPVALGGASLGYYFRR
jgi:hypothetical protein